MARVLLVGGTGYLGSLVGSALLTRTQDYVVLASRPGRERDDILARLRMEMSASGDAAGRALERLRIVRLPDPGDQRGFESLFRENRINDVVNCAGSVHYFDVAQLKQSNVDLVDDLLTASKGVDLCQFTHVSTAFAGGYTDGFVREGLLGEPESDPTEYTRHKRKAEHLVGASGLPYLILRPSIVIGDSRDGHYFGPAYGVYQFWYSTAKVLMDRYRKVIHAIASDNKLPLVHQDAFVATLLAAREKLPRDFIVNVVSSPDDLPTVAELWRSWGDRVVRPHELRLHNSLDDVPLRTLDPRMRAFLNFTAVNSEISGREWTFETTNRDRLIRDGLKFPQVTMNSFIRCMNRFAATSELVRSYYDKFQSEFPDSEVGASRIETADNAAG